MDNNVKGLREHLEALEALPEDIDRAVLKHMNKLGNEWLNEARNLTPYDKGSLKRGFKFDGSEKRRGKTVIELYNNTEYAAAIEFGHRQEVGRYVPAIGKRLVRSWIPGHRMLEKSRQKAYRALPDTAKAAMQEVIDDYTK